MKTKVIPAMADDWVISTGSYNTDAGFILSSKKLNQKVADIALRRFLDFCAKENLVIEGLKLKGNFIVGNDRSVYTEDMYYKWVEMFETRTEVTVSKKDLKPGYKYSTEGGETITYLGKKYISKLKSNKDNMVQFSKPTLKYLYLDQYKTMRELNTTIRNEVVNGGVSTPETCAKKIAEYADGSDVIYCSDTNIKKPKLLFEIYDLKYKGHDSYYTCNAVQIKGEVYISERFPSSAYVAWEEGVNLRDFVKYNIQDNRKGEAQRVYGGYNAKKTPVDEYLRAILIEE